MFTATLAVICLALTLGAYAMRRITLAVGAAFSWLLLGMRAYGESVAEWDIYYSLFFFCIAMLLTIAVESVTFWRNQEERNVKTKNEIAEQRKEGTSTENDYETSKIDKVRRKHGLSKSEIRERNKENRRFYG